MNLHLLPVPGQPPLPHNHARYDGDGKRAKKSNGKLYWYGMGSDPLTETDSAGTPSSEFIFFNGKRTARLDLPSAAVHYYFSDHLGSASVVTSATGTIQDESDYYPFGGERTVTNTDPNQYKFTGKERDSESGLDFFGARYYASVQGRFLTIDLGSPLAANPQSWNRYSNVLNNPLNLVDPDGNDPISPQLLNQIITFDDLVQQDVNDLIADYRARKEMFISLSTLQDLRIVTDPSVDLATMGAARSRLVDDFTRLRSNQITRGVDSFLNDPKTTTEDIQRALGDLLVAQAKREKETQTASWILRRLPGAAGKIGRAVVFLSQTRGDEARKKAIEKLLKELLRPTRPRKPRSGTSDLGAGAGEHVDLQELSP